LRAIKGGRISGARDQAGAWTVEPVELYRVFPPTSIAFASASAAPKAMPEALPGDAQARALDALVADLRAQLADMRGQRDAWQGIAERLALGAPKPAEPKPTPELAAPKRLPWWRRFARFA
jgi:hypothetical protein